MSDRFQLGEYLKSGVRSYHWTPWKLGLNGVAALFIVSGIAVGAMSGGGDSTSQTVSNQTVSREDAMTSETSKYGPPVSAARPDAGDANALLPRIDIDTGGGDPGNGDPTTNDPSSTPVDPPATTTPQDPGSIEEGNDWSPTLLKNGFGFFVAFAIGFALRTLFKFSTFVIGAQLIVLVVLSAAGWIDIRWDVMGAQFELLLTSAGEQFQSFETFIKGQIPTTAFSSAGLYTGLRKS